MGAVQKSQTTSHEANLLTEKAHHQLGWSPRWVFVTTVKRTVGWYRQVQKGEASALASCLAELAANLQ